MKNNKKQNNVPNLRKKSSIIATSTIAATAVVGSAIGLGVTLNNQNNTQTISSSIQNTTPSSVILFKSTDFNVQKTSGNQQDVWKYKNDQNKFKTFYTTFEFIKAFKENPTDREALYRSLFNAIPTDRQVQLVDNGTVYTMGEWQFGSYDAGTEQVTLQKKAATSETIVVKDESAYYPNSVSIGDALKDNVGNEKQFKEIKAYSNFLETLNSEDFRKVSNETYSKIRGFVSSTLPIPVSNVAIAKTVVTVNSVKEDLLIVIGTDAENRHIVYTVNNLPTLYTYDQLTSELPTFDEVIATDFDYKAAIKTKVDSLSGTTIFDNRINKVNLLANWDSNVRIEEDGTIELKDGATTIYITQGNSGYIYYKLERTLGTTAAVDNQDYPYTWDLIDYEKLLRIVANNGIGKTSQVPLSNVFTNKLFNSFLQAKNFVSSQGKIYYQPSENALYILDESIGSKKAVKIHGLPRVLRSDALVKFENESTVSDTDKPKHNKEVFKIEDLAKSIVLNVDDAESQSEDQLKENVRNILKENFNAAKNNANSKIGIYPITTSTADYSVDTTTAVVSGVFGNANNYTYYKLDSGNESYYVINANSFTGINANKQIFKDKDNYEANQVNVVGSYLTVNDVKLSDLNAYLDRTYTGQSPEFSKTTSKVIRVVREGGDRFVVINTSASTLESKAIILYALPKVLTTTEAFKQPDFTTKSTIDHLVDKIIEDFDTNNQTTKTPDQIFVEILNPLLNRKQGDDNKALVAGNEYDFNPTNESSPGTVKLQFDSQANRKLINLVNIADNKILEKIQVQINADNNPNGYIPNVKRVKWAKNDQDSLAFFKLYNSLTDGTQPNTKVLAAEILNDQYIKENAPDIKGGIIEYRFDAGYIILKDKDEQQAIIFTEVPRITTIADIYSALDTGLDASFPTNVADGVIAKYGISQDKPSYDQHAFIESLVNAKSSGSLKIGNYTLSKDNKTYNVSEKATNALDDGPNNSDRKYKTYVYEIVDSADQNKKIKIYDNTNYLDAKKAYALYTNTVGYKQWYNIFNALNSKNSYADGLELTALKTIAPAFVKKITDSINDEGFGFVEEAQTKIFIVEKLNKKQLVIAGQKHNLSDVNEPTTFGLLIIDNLPNIVDEANATFTLPSTQDLVAFNGDYNKSLKENLKNLLSNGSYNLPTPYTPDNNGDLKLNEASLKFEIAKYQASVPGTTNTWVDALADQGTFIKLYKGAASSFGSLTIFLPNNKKVNEGIGTDYTKKLDHKHTLKYWKGFAANSTLSGVEKQTLINQLITEQNNADSKFKAFNFNVSSTTGVDILYDEGKFVVYENYNDKPNSRVAIIYGVQKVISTHDLINNASKPVYLQVLEYPYYGDINKLINEKIKTPNNLLTNGKLFNFTYNNNDQLHYTPETKVLTFNNFVVNVVEEETFIVKPQKIFTDPTRYKTLVTSLPEESDANAYAEYSDKQSEPDVSAAANTLANDNVTITKIFKMGRKMVFVGTKDNQPVYVLFTGSPEFTTDVNQSIEWLNVYKAIEYTSKQSVFSTNNLDSLVKEGLKSKLKSGSQNIVVIENKEYDLNAMTLSYTKHNDEKISIVNINQNGILDIIIEIHIASLSSENLDTFIALNSKENIAKIANIIKKIKAAPKTAVNGVNNMNTVSYNNVDGITEITPQNKTFDQIYYDETNQIIWLINSTKDTAFAVTNVPEVVELQMDESLKPIANSDPNNQDQENTRNNFYVSTKLPEYDLSPRNMLEAYVRDQSTSTVISDVTITGNTTIEIYDDVYLIGYGDSKHKRLAIFDKSEYHLSQDTNASDHGINATTTFTGVVEFKKLYDALTDDQYVSYSTLQANGENIVNEQLDNEITRLGLTKANVKLMRKLYQTKGVIFLSSLENDVYKVYLLYNLPKVAQPSKVKIPSVYSFVKYNKDNDVVRFEKAIKNELDPSASKVNQTVDLFGTSVPFDSARVEIDRTTNTIKVVSSTDRNVFDNKSFDYLPNYKALTLSGVQDNQIYELIKLFKGLNDQSELDTSEENNLNTRLNKKPQRQVTADFLNNELVAAKLSEAYPQNNKFTADNLAKMSVEYHLDNRLGDRFILRFFDDANQNRLTDAFIIEGVKRIVKLNDNLTIDESNFVRKIAEEESAAKAVEEHLRTTIGSNTATTFYLDELYDYTNSLVVNQHNANFIISDGNSGFAAITVLSDLEYIATPVIVADSVFKIKEYKQAYDQLVTAGDTEVSLTTLNNKELTAIVNDFGNGMDVTTTTVILKDNRLIFKNNQKLLVGINLPKVLVAKTDAQAANVKVPTFDHIVSEANESKNINVVYSEFFKNVDNYAEVDGNITITQTEPALSYTLNKANLSLNFMEDDVLELSSKATGNNQDTIVYVILEPKNEQDNITLINAAYNDANETFDLLKLLTADNEGEMDITDEMKNTSFIKNDSFIPTNFFNEGDTVKIKYLLSKDKILITNNTTNKSLIFYNVARVVGYESGVYSIDDIVNADKRTQVYLKEKLNSSETTPLKWGKYDILRKDNANEVSVTNVGVANNSMVSKPGEPSKAQVVVIDNVIYHLGFEKISAKDEFASVVAFDNYQKSVTNDFVNVDANAIPNELKHAVFNPSYGAMDIANTKVKKIGENNNAKLIFFGLNTTTHQEHVVVVYNFPEVYNPTSDNDVLAPTIKQLASVDGLDKGAYFDANAILTNTLKNVLKDANNKIMRTEFDAATSEITVKRPSEGQEDIPSNYNYTITNAGQNKTLVPKDKVPHIYGYDASRNNKNAIDIAHFEAKYNELLAASSNNKVLWGVIKDNAYITSLIAENANHPIDAAVRNWLNDANINNDTWVEFDKATDRLLVFDESNSFLIVFGEVLRTATNTNALPTPLYTHSEVVANNNNLQNTILEKLNALTPDTPNVNGYEFTKPFSISSANNGVFNYGDNNNDSKDLYFVDETTYTTFDARNITFANLVDFYKKTIVHLRTLDANSEVDVTTINDADLTSILNQLNFNTTNQQPKILLGGDKLAVYGVDATTNKDKVITLILPVIKTLDFDVTAADLDKAQGNTLEEKVANSVKNKLKESHPDGNIDLNGEKVNLDDPNVKLVAKEDPSDPANKIVEVIKDGKVVGTYVMRSPLPTFKVIDWSKTNATPLQTWNYLWNIKNNQPVDPNKPNQKAINWVDFTNQTNNEFNLFTLAFIDSILSNSENNAQKLKDNPGKSIEYNQEKNEVILRAGDATLTLVNVTKVVNASYMKDNAKQEMFSGYEAYLQANTSEIDSLSPINTIQTYFNTLSVDLKDNTRLINDQLNSYKVKTNANLTTVSTTYKDALTYKFSIDGSNDFVYVIDTRFYDPQQISGLADFEQDANAFVTLRDAISDSELKPVAEFNNETLNRYANNRGLTEAKLIKQTQDSKTVFVLVGKKTITRDQVVGGNTTTVSELVEAIVLIHELPETPNLDAVLNKLPSDQEIMDNGGDIPSLVKQALEDKNKFPQSGDPATIDFGGVLVTLPIASVEVKPDGAMKIVDGNGKVIIIPPKANQTIYKEYELNPEAQDPRDDTIDFRFTDVINAKALYDLIDNQPLVKDQERSLTTAMQENPGLKKILDNYKAVYQQKANAQWDLSKATISYNRETNVIVIKDNLTGDNVNPRVLILRNAPRVIYAQDLSKSTDEYYLEMVLLNNDIKAQVKNKINNIKTQNPSAIAYTIGNLVPNSNKVRSSYDQVANPSVLDNPYANNENIFVISYEDVRTKVADQKIYVVDKTQYLPSTKPQFNDLTNLFEQLKSFKEGVISQGSLVTNQELVDNINQAFGGSGAITDVYSVINYQQKLVVLFKENNEVKKAYFIDLPKLISQNKAKLPTKEDIANSDLLLSELILSNFKNPNKFTPNANNEIELDGLVFNPNDVEIEVGEDGLIKIIQKGSDPKNVLGTIVANNPIFPSRVIIDNTDALYKLERNPYEIYELTSLINKLPSNINSFIKLTDEMKNINFLKAKLNAAYPQDQDWYNNENTKIMYDIENNQLVIDNNNDANNKMLVIKNVDRVLRNADSNYKLFTLVDIAQGYNLEHAANYKQDAITKDQVILDALTKALLKVDYEQTINNYTITLKDKNTIASEDLVFVADDTYKLPNEAQPWLRYVKWTTKNNQSYIILDDTYYNFSKLDAKAVFNDNPAFKLLFDGIIKANQKLEINDEVKQKTPQLEQWLNDIRNDANFDTSQPLLVSFVSGPNLVITTTNNNMKYVAVISDVPRVVNEKDIGLKLPTDEEVISNNGDYGKSILDKLNDPKQFPRNADGKITLNGYEVDPSNLGIRVNDDGSLELFDKTNEKLIISITPSIPTPAYHIVNAQLQDAVFARRLYDLIGQTNPLIKSKPNQKTLVDQLQAQANQLINHSWIKENIIDVYSAPNNVANIQTDFSKWTVEYNANENKLVFRGRNTDLEKREQVLVVNNIVKAIWSNSLYNYVDVLNKENKTTSLDQALDLVMIRNFNAAIKVAEYDANQTPTVASELYNNELATNEPQLKSIYKVLSLDNQKLVVIDNTNYLPTAIGYEVLSDYEDYAKLNKELNLSINVSVPLFAANVVDAQPLSKQIYDHFVKLGSTDAEIKQSATMIKTPNYIMLVGIVNQKVVVQKITDLPNVVSRSQIPYPSTDDIIDADGDRGLAVERMLNDETKFLKNPNGTITIGDQEIDLNNVLYETDDNGNVSIFAKDANGNKILPAKAIIMAKSDNPDENIDPKIYKEDASRFFASYVQEIIANIYEVNKDKSTQSIRLLKDVASNQVIQDLIQNKIIVSDAATIEFRKDAQQLVIRDNDANKPSIIIVSTKSILNSDLTQAQLVKYQSNTDYWVLWVSIASVLGGIGIILLIGLFIYWLNKRQRRSK